MGIYVVHPPETDVGSWGRRVEPLIPKTQVPKWIAKGRKKFMLSDRGETKKRKERKKEGKKKERERRKEGRMEGRKEGKKGRNSSQVFKKIQFCSRVTLFLECSREFLLLLECSSAFLLLERQVQVISAKV